MVTYITMVTLTILNKLKRQSHKELAIAQDILINVYTFSPEDLIKEKTETYLSRRKIRDLYDIFFLLNFVEDKSYVSKDLSKFVDNFKDPVDVEDLKALIISGMVPSVPSMLEVVKRWAK